METYPHHVLGLYDTWNTAEATRDALQRCGLPASHLRLLQPDLRLMGLGAKSEASASDLVIHGAAPARVEAIEQTLAGVSLFAASPVLGALMAHGWRASLGRLVAVLESVGGDADDAQDAQDAQEAEEAARGEERPVGAAVLVVQADDERQAVLARVIVAASMGGSNLASLRDDRAEARDGAPRPQELAGADPMLLRTVLNRRRQPERRAAAAPD